MSRPDDADRASLLTRIARQYGTPAYVYELDAVASAAESLTADLPADGGLLYSLKANPHPEVVARLLAGGAGAEVSSSGELAAALAAGCPPDRIMYTGPGKDPRQLAQALSARVRCFSVESPADRDRLADACGRAGVDAEYLVRLNTPRGSARGSLRMTGRPTAFGTDVANRQEIAALLRPRGRARPVGTHTFSASNVEDPAALLQEFRNALAAVRDVCDAADLAPQLLALGGGFPAPMARPGTLARHPDLAAGLEGELEAAFPGRHRGGPRILFESGRYLTATAGTLLTTVLDVKTSGGRTFVVLDAGVNVLGGMSGLGRLMSPRAQPAAVGASDGGEERAVTLVGPLCTPLDVLNASARLVDPRPGQLLAVPNTGAYGPTASLLGFLSHPGPVEVVVEGARVRSARRLAVSSEEVAPRV
ncbi:type III PLP-dependent enzyme [Streptomyces sp. XM4193]|uniref:type III PLP-dependent enzyme n=1 Tax=Streptomyces sp. XM4193 TaxID=2929782 RepID=UPI001FF9446D|nr:type III PLP-dependent enzyme [Streptomyces sp. XM4193]MCK1798978.1 type III PLP-dependent enzyme [Streptomyces sp. XM4193]